MVTNYLGLFLVVAGTLTVITGTGAASLGEALVVNHARLFPNCRIFGVDIVDSPLTHLPEYHHLKFDLIDNSLETLLETSVSQHLRENELSHVSLLIQSAGIYTSGPLSQTPAALCDKVLAVNLTSRVRMLRAIMKANAAAGLNNSECLSYFDIGSSHGLTISSGRALYGATKGFMLGMCARLFHSGELSRALYFALGPIDTHMLHLNHWHDKASGEAYFLEKALQLDPALYNAIFRDCDASAYCRACELTNTSRNIELFELYRKARATASNSAIGIITAEDCASAILSTIRAQSSGIISLNRGTVSLRPVNVVDFRNHWHSEFGQQE